MVSLRTVTAQIGHPLGHIPVASVLRNELDYVVTPLSGASRTLNAEHREVALDVAKNVVGSGHESRLL
jgi:hypothetical protein